MDIKFKAIKADYQGSAVTSSLDSIRWKGINLSELLEMVLTDGETTKVKPRHEEYLYVDENYMNVWSIRFGRQFELLKSDMTHKPSKVAKHFG